MSSFKPKLNQSNWFFGVTSEYPEILNKTATRLGFNLTIHGTILGGCYVLLQTTDLEEFEKFKRYIEKFTDIEPLGCDTFEFNFREEWEHQYHEVVKENGIELFDYEEIKKYLA